MQATNTEDRSGATSPSPASIPADRVIVVERELQAPRPLVWAAWTDPKHVDQWWGPNGFRNETLAMDFREGGQWRYVMHGPDGKAWPNWIRYERIVDLERLEYSHGGGEDDSPQFHVTVTFVSQGAVTKVSMRSVFPSADACAAVKAFGAVEGGQQTLARLAGHLPHVADGTAATSMVLTRLFDAPVPLVFAAWSEPAMLARWWGPKRFTLPTCETDFRPGGAYRMVMRDPMGGEHPFHGHYLEIVPNERIVFDASILGGVEVTTTVTFVAEGDKTRLTVRQTIPTHAGAAAGQREGWSGSLEKLAAMLKERPMPSNELEIILDPDEPTILTRRKVHAPRELVFDAFTRPEHIRRWMGPAALTWVECESDLRVGGKYRWVQRSPDGMEFAFYGEFKEVVRPERVVRTFVFEPMPDHGALETLTLEEHDGVTTVTTLTVHKTMQGRDGHVAEGRMEEGMTEGYARLDELVASLRSAG